MVPRASEEKVTCTNKKCHKRFTRKLGTKNNGHNVTVKCPHCGTSQSVANHG